MSFDHPSSAGPGPRWTGDGSLAPRVPAPEDHSASPAHRSHHEARATSGSAQREVVVGDGPVLLASIPRRSVAFVIDFALRYLVLQVLLALLGVSSAEVTVEVFLAAQLWVTGWNVIFFAQGWTPGALIMGLRIVRLSDGSAPGFRWGAVRAAGAILSDAALAIGYVWAFWDDRRQTWHDKFAGTVVVMAPRDTSE